MYTHIIKYFPLITLVICASIANALTLTHAELIKLRSALYFLVRAIFIFMQKLYFIYKRIPDNSVS